MEGHTQLILISPPPPKYLPDLTLLLRLRKYQIRKTRKETRDYGSVIVATHHGHETLQLKPAAMTYMATILPPHGLPEPTFVPPSCRDDNDARRLRPARPFLRHRQETSMRLRPLHGQPLEQGL